MRLIGKLLALPFMLVTGILYLVCKFLVVLSGAVLGILSGIIFLAALVLIHMGADNKGMVSFCELQCQLPADLISFFWRNFAGLKCLTEMVGDHIICTLISAGQICILSFGKKKLCISKPGITLIAINEFSKIGFLRIFYIINNI